MRSSLVQFRAGLLAEELAERGDEPYGQLAQRDLERYYHLAQEELQRLDLDEAEAS